MTYDFTLTVTIPTGLSKEEDVEFREEKRRAYIRYLKSLSEKSTSLPPLKPGDPIVMKPVVKQGPSTPPTLFEFLSPRGRELATKACATIMSATDSDITYDISCGVNGS